jgi:macrolide-specific efflux system membrane fusion protein
MTSKRALLTLAAAAALALAGCSGKAAKGSIQKVAVTRGDLNTYVQATGNIQPLNLVSILPPVTGRVDKIVADEGATVKKGQVLAWMSSSDRAALLDMARAKGDAELKYWEDVYKPTPIVAPVNGLIINRNVVEGQTVASSTDLYDMSDRLIVLAAVDETDLGSIRLGQQADVTVDAYPNDSFPCKVIMITHEAVKVNNVVSYYVKLEAAKAPAELRAGMTANINFRVNQYPNALLLPSWAVKGAQQATVSVMVKKPGDGKDAKPQQAQVKLGDTDGSQVVVLSGLDEGDTVVVSSLSLPDASSSASLFGGPPRMSGKSAGVAGTGSKGH